MMKRSLIAAAIALITLPASAAAQDPDDRRSHFGVIATFSPPSDLRDEFKVLFDAEQVEVRSRDFEIGFIVRGRQIGGDWGVSYVQKTYEDGSVVGDTIESCFSGPCFKYGTLDIMRSVRLRGVSIHKFAPFVTIKRRAQIGLNFSGGVAKARGTVERHEFNSRQSGPNTFVQTETVTEVNAKELFLDGRETIPIWRVEIAAAALLAPGLKVRAGAGLDFTNYPAFSVSAVYLIGSK